MPLFSAIVGAVSAVGGFIASATGIGGMLLRGAIGVGLSYAAQALAGKPKPQSQAFSLQGTIRAAGTVPRSYMSGKGMTAGSLVYANTWGEPGRTPNSLLVQVIALSDLPAKGLAEVWVNGEKVSLFLLEEHADLGFPVAEYRKDGMDHLWVKFYDGTQTVADPYLVDKFGADENFPYESSRVGYGVAYVIITSRVSDTLFTGFPEFKFALAGTKFYDPSRDTTVGGDGPQRIDNPATWGGDGDDLPIVQLFSVVRGIYYVGEWFYGLQNVALAQLPVAAWIAAINKCRAAVETEDGEEPLYRCGGEVLVSTRIADTVEALLTSCNGRLAEIGGFYKPKVGTNDAPVGSFVDGDILPTAPQSFTPFHGLADTINGISAKYPDPAEGWNVKAAPTRLDPALEARDGNRRLLADVDYSMVPYKWQVQRLMEEALLEAARAAGHTLTLPPSFWVYEPLDVLAFGSDRHGYEGKAFRIDGMTDLANLDVLVDLTEVDPDEFDPAEITYIPVVDGPIGIARPAPQPIIDWYAEPYVLQASNGEGRRAAIKLSWDGAIDDVEAVEYEIRLAGEVEVVARGRTDQVAAASLIVSQSLLSNEDYEVRGRYIPASDRETLWSAWLPVTTPAITAEAVYDLVKERAITLLAEVDASIKRLARIVAEQDASSFTERESLARELRVQVGNARAFFNERIDVAVGPGSALAESIAEAGAAVEELEAKVSTRFVSAVDTEGGVALWELKATVQNVSAGQRVFVASDGMGGYIAHVGFIANKFYIQSAAGETPLPVFLVDGGNVYLSGDLIAAGSITAAKINVSTLSAIAANMGTVTAGVVRSSDSKLIVDLDNKEIVIAD